MRYPGRAMTKADPAGEAFPNAIDLVADEPKKPARAARP
jgi:hypothetical protein